MIPSEYLLPYLISNAIALGLLWLAVRRPGWVRWASIGIFLWATYTNTRIALFHPHDYQDFARLAVLASYRSFITGWFRNHTALVLLPIAAGQCAIALLLLRNTPLTRRLGVLGALSFLLAIAPLGAGSAFPFSLTYGLALVVMMRRLDRETRADVAASPLHPFIPAFDARERFAVTVRAPAQLVDQVARAFDMQSIPLVRAIFRMREWMMGVTPDPRPVQGFIAEMRGLGWGALVDRPGEVFVAGATCQPWLGEVRFTAVPLERFRPFDEPGLVKIAWSLESRATSPSTTELVTETRVKATDEQARRRFLGYWRWARFGIIPIRWLMLPAIRREAEAAYRPSPHPLSPSP